MEFPLDYVRGCFPALEGSSTIHFENASAPPELGTVRALRETASAAAHQEMLRETRESLAFFLNSNDAWAGEEIVLASDAGELMRRLAVAHARSFEPGSEVIVTELDHEWSISPWFDLAERGITVKVLPLKRASAGIDENEVAALLTDRTRLVVVTKASPPFGTICELLPVALLLRAHPGSLLVNWTSFLAHGALDVRFLRSDFVIAATGSLFGSRLGFLWGRRERMRALRETSFDLFEDLEPETADVVALGAALRYIEDLGLLSQEMQIQPSEDYGRRRHMRRGMQAIRHYERTLCSLALRRLAAVPGARLYGIEGSEYSARRTPHLFFRLGDRDPAEVAAALARRNIQVGQGACGSPRAVAALGLPERGGICASLAHYNTESEVERFAEALHEIALGPQAG